MKQEVILVIGASGQIGTALTAALREAYGANNVLATDIRPAAERSASFFHLDALDKQAIFEFVRKHQVTQLYHLAALLSARAEQMPQQAWHINMGSLFNVLEVAKELKLRLFFPSSIAVFGPRTPKTHTPQHTVLEPTTVYGISKVAGETWCQYYHDQYGLDVRSVRYPGIIGYESMPGGGTTDYAVHIFHEALKHNHYDCFLDRNTRLPMMYMADAVRATLEIMMAPTERIQVRTGYNLAGINFTPAELAEAIRKYRPQFTIDYQPDFRQAIADSWVDSIDDSAAQRDWNWKHEYDLDRMTRDMLVNLERQLAISD